MYWEHNLNDNKNNCEFAVSGGKDGGIAIGLRGKAIFAHICFNS